MQVLALKAIAGTELSDIKAEAEMAESSSRTDRGPHAAFGEFVGAGSREPEAAARHPFKTADEVESDRAKLLGEGLDLDIMGIHPHMQTHPRLSP